MRKLVLTGGPCSGKTTVIAALREEFGSRLVFVPEAATLLLEGGFPIPGRDLEWSQGWQDTFQAAVLPLQESMEDAKVMTKPGGFFVCDRGILDGAAYVPGGVAEFCRVYNVNMGLALKRYCAIIHLESLASADPSKYGNANNASRFEPLERAQELEAATRAAWAGHPRQIVIKGGRGIEGKISQVIGIVRCLMTEPA